MNSTLPAALELIGRYRDRFSGWALVVNFIALIMALWTTAPALDVEIPLVGGARVGINVGYILMAGMPVLVFATAWAMAPLIAMRRLQEAVVAELLAAQKGLGPIQLRAFAGPFPQLENGADWRTSAVPLLAGVRYFVLFVIPVLAHIWIAEEYFFQLHAYDKSASIRSLVTTAEQNLSTARISDWRIPLKQRISSVEYLFNSKPRDSAGNALRYFMIENSDLERACAQLWVKDHLADESAARANLSDWEVRLRTDLEARTKDRKCVADAFPRFELAVNSWINLVALVLAIWLAVAGWLAYTPRRLVRQIPMTAPAYQSPSEGDASDA